MARPTTKIKTPVSAAIAELRRRLSHSQQGFSNLLGVSLPTVAKWETNTRPGRTELGRLLHLAGEHGWEDLVKILYREHERAYQVEYAVELTRAVALQTQKALLLADQLSLPRHSDVEHTVENLKKVLRRIQADISILSGVEPSPAKKPKGSKK
jgi:hypothetical protein